MAALPDTRYSLLVRLGDPANQAAWAEFLDLYHEAVLRYCRSHGLQEADACDVAQEVLLTVHRAVASWQPSGRPGSFRAWLVQTAHRSCLRMWRNRRGIGCGVGGSSVQEKLEAVTASDDVVDPYEGEWQRWAFCWAAGQVQREVEPATWQAFQMSAVENQPPADVARKLGMRVGSVYAAKCRVLARLRARVDELSRSE